MAPLFSRKRLAAALSFVALSFSACDGDNNPDTSALDPSATSCSAQSAKILIQDGYFKDLCGCAEGTTTYVQPTPMTCTVATGTVLFFIFSGSSLSHQILSTGSPSFPSSPLWDPSSSGTSNAIYAYQFQTAGTYTFIDAIDNSMSGSVIAQ